MMEVPLLNENQTKAVNWNDGPLLVLAGPGSGKTRVLTHRVGRIIRETAGKSFHILGLTFTNKAAAEMSKRVAALVPDSAGRVNLTTYHSFSAAILRQHGHLLDISPDFVVLSQDADRLDLLKDAIDDVGGAEYDSRRLLPLISRLTDQNVAADKAAEYLRENMDEDASRIGMIYGHYRQLMIKHNALDYGGLVAEALNLLANAAVRELIRDIYQYVCVDEFQDTSMAEYELLRSVVNPRTKNLFVVADYNQAIYEWKGADSRRLEQIRQHFDMDILNLPENYRCPSSVVEMSDRLIANNHGGMPSVDGDMAYNAVRVMEFATAEEETEWIAKDIEARSVSERARCTILARNRRPLEQVVAALKARDIRAHLHAAKSEFSNERMVWMYSALKLANARQDCRQLRSMCRSFNSLENTNLIDTDIASVAMLSDGDYLRAWVRAALREELEPATKSFLEGAMHNLVDRLDFRSFIKDCFEWFERRQKSASAPDYDEYCAENAVWRGLVNDAALGRDQTLSSLLQQIDRRSKEPPAPEGAIHCYTVFASKGMGFDHTYLIRLTEDELPDWRAVKQGGQSREMAAERRVCFVAITRTQKTLTMTYPLEIAGRRKNPSRFLAEMGMARQTVR